MITLDFEQVNCPLCGSNVTQVLHTLEDFYTRQPGQFTLVQCQQCGLGYLNPRPTVESIGNYYPSNYGPHAARGGGSASNLQRWLEEYGWRKRCKPLGAVGPSGKILDIGCGNGQFLAAMQKYFGWSGVGIDLNREVVEYANRELGLETYVGRLEDMHFPDQLFDAVTLWDVLEHLPDPRGSLREVRRILKPQGRLLLRVPSLDSVDAHLFGRYFAGLDSPRHLSVFSRRTIARLLAETGFKMERMWNLSGSRASFALSLRLRFLRQEQAGRWRSVGMAIFNSPVCGVVCAPYFFLIDRLGLGPELTVFARKSSA